MWARRPSLAGTPKFCRSGPASHVLSRPGIRAIGEAIRGLTRRAHTQANTQDVVPCEPSASGALFITCTAVQEPTGHAAMAPDPVPAPSAGANASFRRFRRRANPAAHLVKNLAP
jgi:hypothetical protein